MTEILVIALMILSLPILSLLAIPSIYILTESKKIKPLFKSSLTIKDQNNWTYTRSYKKYILNYFND